MFFTSVDLGSSGTRTGRYGSIDVIEIPNNMVEIPTEENVDLELSTDEHSAPEERLLSALDVTITKKAGDSKYFPCRVLVGELARRYSSANDTPDVSGKKSGQKINYIGAILGLAANRYLFNAPETQKLVYLLPPLEAKHDKVEMSGKLTGKYRVEFNKLHVGFDIEVVEAIGEEEAKAAMLYFFLSDPENRKNYNGEYQLLVDIGNSTTDVIITYKGKYLEQTGMTLKIGGQVIAALLNKEILAEYGYNLNEESIKEAVATGYIKKGKQLINIKNLLVKAKMEFARELTTRLKGYFQSVGIPIEQIEVIVVAGGGSMQSSYVDENGTEVVTSESMASYLVQKLTEGKDISMDVVPVSNDKRLVRLANVLGVTMLYTALEDKAAALKNSTSASA